MNFERARTDQQIHKRKTEIIEACSQLFNEFDYDGVNLKAISSKTSIGRSTIYTYYKTKDEILMDVLLSDAQAWSQTLQKKMNETSDLSKSNFARIMTQAFIQHDRLMKLMTLLYSTLEKNCRLEVLVDFKVNLNRFLLPFLESVQKFFPDASYEHLNVFIVSITSLVNGLYPMTQITCKQAEAMKQANFTHFEGDFEDLCYKGILALTSMI